MASEIELKLEALFARIESPKSLEAVDALFAGKNLDLNQTFKPGPTETPLSDLPATSKPKSE